MFHKPQALFVFDKCMLLKIIREQLGTPAFICPKHYQVLATIVSAHVEIPRQQKAKSWLRMKIVLSPERTTYL